MFGLRTDKFVGVVDFASAERVFISAKAVRGTDKNHQGVPLRKDRRQWKNYRLLKRGDNSYVCRLYNTDVVTFYRDGSILLDITYGSVTTNSFATRFAPIGISCSNSYAQPIVYSANGAWYAGSKPVRLINEDCKGYKWVVDPESVPPLVYPKVNPTRAAATRKKYAPLLAYLKTMQALGPINKETWDGMADGSWRLEEALNKYSPTDPASFPVLVACLYHSRWWAGVQHCELPDGADKILRELLYKLDGAVDMIALPPGTLHPKMRLATV